MFFYSEEGSVEFSFDPDRYCQNCWRQQMVNDDSKYRLCFRTIESNEIARQKLCILKSLRNFSITTYTVCKQCYCYLKKEEGNTVVENAKRKNWENTWPSFIGISFLANKKQMEGNCMIFVEHQSCGS